MNLRLYRLHNRGRFGCWVFAESEEEAIDIAFAGNFARKRENITVVGDQTESFRENSDIDTVTQKGFASLELESMPFMELLDYIKRGENPPSPKPGKWHVSMSSL